MSGASAPAASAPPDALPGVWGLLRRRPWRLLAATLQIGVGVAALPCCGVGAVGIVFGSAALLEQLAVAAGAPPPRTRLMPGLIALVLATLLGLAASLGVSLAGDDFWTAVGTFSLAGALMGAALAPLAFTPMATMRSGVPLAEGLVRAVDMAGGDRLTRLAPLCASIAVTLLVPVPVVAMGLSQLLLLSRPEVAAAGAIAFVVWIAAVPVSGAALTLRYLRLERGNDAPTQLRGATSPLVGATAIGLVTLTVALGSALLSPRYFESVSSDGPRVTGAEISHARVTRRHVRIESPRGPQLLSFPTDRLSELVGGVDWPACSEGQGPDGSRIIQCDRGDRRYQARIDRAGAPIPIGPVPRLRQVMTRTTTGALLLALLSLGLALFWLGRLGVALRLLFRPPFTLDGVVEPSADGGPLRFEASDGARRVHVPEDRVAAADRVTRPTPASLLTTAPVPPMTFREAYAPCPPDALLVLGSRETALRTHLSHARRIGFRLALVTLTSLVAASIAILLAI